MLSGGGPASGSAAPSRRGFALLYAAPAMLLLVAVVAPLVSGARTLYLRDVLSVHFEMKWVQAEALAEGRLPLIDAWRSGGQPLAGNPNGGPFYPATVLLLVASPLWALNAHFWMHLLLAPWTGYWMGRAWGLGRAGSWATGVTFAASGFFLSNLNLYNLVAGVAWTPALVAACLDLAAGRRPRASFFATGAIWGLLVTAGDPMTALAALALAAGALALGPARRRLPWVPLAAAFSLGTLAAAPQIVELLRILPDSFRGHQGYSLSGVTAASWHPAAVADWLLPFAYGLPDLTFWGQAFYTDGAPLYFSLFPGVLALLLVVASGRPRGAAAAWAWAAIALGLFIALGRFNPVVSWLAAVSGTSVLRFPVKLWLLVATGGALLCGLGFERLASGDGRRSFGRALGVAAAVYGAAWLALTPPAGPGFRLLARLMPAATPPALVAGERLRWAGCCLLILLLLALAALVLRVSARRPAMLAALLVLHVASQLLLLRPLLASDATEHYLEPPPALAHVPAGARLVQGDHHHMFGPEVMHRFDFPDASLVWLRRETWRGLFPGSAVAWGRRPELAVSPEGLDAFLTRAAVEAMLALDDARRLRLLAASGVEVLLLQRRLAEGTEELARLVAELPMTGAPLRIYRLAAPAPAVLFVGTVTRAPHLNAALARLTSAGFDPRRETVIPGGGPRVEGRPGRVTVLRDEPERLEVEVEAPGPGVLVAQKTPLPIVVAEVDGRPAPIVAANLHRLGVELEAGRHRVVIRTDRRPLRAALALAALALAALTAAALRRGRR